MWIPAGTPALPGLRKSAPAALRAERRRQRKLGMRPRRPANARRWHGPEHAARANVPSTCGGKISPPTMCEACGGRTTVYAWHPDPANWREVAWLCRPCRRMTRATGGTIVLTWQWPGHTLGENRTVPIVERPERRARRDRSAPSSPALPAAEWWSAGVQPFDDEAALARLDAELAARFAEVEAMKEGHRGARRPAGSSTRRRGLAVAERVEDKQRQSSGADCRFAGAASSPPSSRPDRIRGVGFRCKLARRSGLAIARYQAKPSERHLEASIYILLLF